MGVSWVGLFESFAARPFGGNVAGVVVSDTALDRATMLGLAGDLAAPTTGFVCRDEVSDREARTRFFTPTQEIDACGHVTIAVAQALFDLGLWQSDEPKTLTCAGGSFPLTRADDRFVVKQTPRPPPIPAVDLAELGDVLGISVVAMSTASTGLTHLFAEVAEIEDLGLVTAGHDELASLGNRNQVDTIGVYARLANDRVRLRDFTAPIGVLEEPASGTTSGALATIIGRPELTVEQGVEMGRPSELHVRFDGTSVWVGGVARRVLSGQLD